ncbi:dtdp-4-dehydrorhamnose -epimerase-like enzyme [Leptolyngbya sp. Heron Island J]|uniref:dtdp-4-dehydrorhamnose -epimerase-like enzyme n=1 Tax=Leptolyngbya sp. Heron Island J TaxID=1385935 RepID=UPI0003B95E2F|nr:dtdp-4-dehydrorhamnose -epimerase-like enzyme [Leptolyngbya sp. Heron Island J]ESA32755.1 dtdp-4-dehydrorhamnose -epimerase-like enzyme [Leptolyngbya sp. Heron Island J]
MSKPSQITLHPLSSEKSGSSEFYELQRSDQTLVVEVGAGVIEDLFVHHFQTDQLVVVKGSLVIVTLQNQRYEYHALSEHTPTTLEIPPGIPHSAINLSPEPCVVVNSVLRHGPPHERDYQPTKPPFPYDIAKAMQLLRTVTGDQYQYPMLKAI